MSENNKNILVTGFGAFGPHRVNASWESVKLLPKQIDGHNVIIEEVPVAYDMVDKKIKKFWQQLSPQLVVHVGVSGFADKITLETCANKKGYDRKDIFGNGPSAGDECPACTEEHCIFTDINVEEICDYLNKSGKLPKACISENAGRYLCEYIFFTSLSINKGRTLFIHVPPLDGPYSSQELANGIAAVIDCALMQCKQNRLTWESLLEN